MGAVAPRSDLLDGLTARQRLERERAEAAFLRDHTESVASAQSLEREANTWGGTDIYRREDFRALKPDESPDLVTCARYDLQHPLYFPDNLFVSCADCGCDLQHRPNIPSGPKLCICCCARRVREEGSN